MNQAAELYLIQIIERGSLVGMVTFDSSATIQNNLVAITDDDSYQKITANLPPAAGGGTSICSGLKAGFQVKFFKDLNIICYLFLFSCLCAVS